jgi:hypothetical protein
MTMRPLVEAIHSLRAHELLGGRLAAQSETLELWIHRHEAGFDLYLTSRVSAEKLHSGQLFRNTVGRGLASVEELLEAISHLDAYYRISIQEVLHLPVWVREARPEWIERIERRLGRSTRTDQPALEATLVKLDGDGVIEVEPDDPEEDVKHLVLTDT